MVPQYDDTEQCIDRIIAKVGKTLVVGTPLGLGKANLLLNGLYQRAQRDTQLSLTIITALTLQAPTPGSDLEARFLTPLLKRWFDGYPELDYARDRLSGTLPSNVRIHEFFLTPGKYLGNVDAQQNYISSNYTHVARDILSRGVNVVMQMVSPGQGDHSGRVSLSCNPDVTLELIPKMRASGRDVIAIAETNEELPYMYGDADVSADFFDALFVPPQNSYRLFATPKVSVSTTDFMIGLHASALVKDNGTLQIGIGSLGDAVAYCLGKRHTANEQYVDLIEAISSQQSAAVRNQVGETGLFDKGLYGATEMFVDGFLHLFDKGVLKRNVYDSVLLQRLLNEGVIEERVSEQTLDEFEKHGGFAYPLSEASAIYLQTLGLLAATTQIDAFGLKARGQHVRFDDAREKVRQFIIWYALGERLANPCILHGGFYLGDQRFYQRLRELTEEQRSLINMTSVARINQLYRGEELDRLQRINARFINTCLMVTLNGTIVSDGLEDSRVVSGVGGQYNFVAMAHALDDSRSIINLRSTYAGSQGLRSNIVFHYGYTTISRHLRDIVVTEYGSADLRGRSDAECAAALINIADSRFQSALVQQAKASGKLPDDYRIPDEYLHNTPARNAELIAKYQAEDWFGPFPLGTDLGDDEIRLGGALKRLAANTSTRAGMARQVVRALMTGSSKGKETLLARLQLERPQGFKEWLTQRMVASEL